jgi:hypothetical protein
VLIEECLLLYEFCLGHYFHPTILIIARACDFVILFLCRNIDDFVTSTQI